MDYKTKPIETFLSNCTPAEALSAARTLIEHCDFSLPDQDCAHALQLLSLQLMEQLPLNQHQIASDLNMLVDLLTAYQLCKDTAPSLASEYTARWQNTHQLQNLQERTARQELTIRKLQQEAKQLTAEAEQLRSENNKLKNMSPPVSRDVSDLERSLQQMSDQFKEQVKRNTEQRRENIRLQTRLRELEKALEQRSGAASPSLQQAQERNVILASQIDALNTQISQLKERMLRQENTIRKYQTNKSQ